MAFPTVDNCPTTKSKRRVLLITFLYLCLTCFADAAHPVIIDTDIGSYYDDFIAIALAIRSPSLDIKLVVTCSDNTTSRAKITAKLLTVFGRSDIPIGIGALTPNATGHPLFGWAKDFDLSSYKGGVFQDGVASMADVIDKSNSTVDVLCIGPLTNFPELLSHYPEVVKGARITVSGGSIYRGYYNSSKPTAEYNIKICPQCAREAFHAGWNITLAPLDTTSVGNLTTNNLRELLANINLITLAIGNSLVYYCTNEPQNELFIMCDFNLTTPVFFDAVATLLVLPEASQFLKLQEVNITVNNQGDTVIDNKAGVPMQVALYWSEDDGLEHYRQFVTKSLSST